MFKGIDHLDITVEDPEEMASFLIKLGFQEIRRTGGSRGSIELRFPGGDHQPLLELTPARRSDGSKLPLGLRHIALRCENIDEEFKTLSAKGIPFFDTEPRIVPDTGRRLANIKGPEGRFLQMVG